MAVIFILRVDKTKIKKDALIYIRYYIGKSEVRISTNIAIHVDMWDSKKQRIRKKLTDYPINEANEKLNQIEIYVNSYAIRLKLAGSLNKSNLEAAIKEYFKPKKAVSFFEYYENFIIEIETGKRLIEGIRNYSTGSITQFRATKTNLFEYNSRLTFEDFNNDFYLKYSSWLATIKNLMPNTIGSHFKKLKTLLKIADKEGLIDKPEYSSFKVHKKKSESKIALTEIELEELEKLELSVDLSHTRDLFLVGCYTGLRVSNYSKIKAENIKDGHLDLIVVKGKRRIIIPIRAKLKEILEKYNNVLPKISDQNINLNLKEICKKCDSLKQTELVSGIKGAKHFEEFIPRHKLVQSHTARRTFATLAYELGVPTITIREITGHQTDKDFFNYIKTKKTKHAEIFSQYVK